MSSKISDFFEEDHTHECQFQRELYEKYTCCPKKVSHRDLGKMTYLCFLRIRMRHLEPQNPSELLNRGNTFVCFRGQGGDALLP